MNDSFLCFCHQLLQSLLDFFFCYHPCNISDKTWSDVNVDLGMSHDE